MDNSWNEWSRHVLAELQRLNGSQDELSKSVAKIDSTLAVQAVQLEEHIRRTGLAEDNIADLRKEMKPIHRHIFWVEGSLKFLGVLSVLAGIAAAIRQAFF